MTYESFRALKFFPALDGFRALSIIAVIWHHTAGLMGGIPGTGRGFLGVDMFFVLSGFLIVTLLLRERDRHGQISLKKFYMRRTLRIFPVYYGLLAALTALFFIKSSGRSAAFFEELPFYLTYTSNWVDVTVLGIMWSLAAEEQFYLIWPPIETFLRRAALPILFLFIALNQAINFGLLDQQLANIGLDVNHLEILQATFTPICLGVLLAHRLHLKKGYHNAARILGHRWSPLALAAFLILICNMPNADISGLHRLSIQVTMCLFLGSCVMVEKHHLATFLTWKPLARIGKVSYGMYIFHMLARDGLFGILERLNLNHPILLFTLCGILTWIIAECSFRFFESRFLKLKDRFAH